MTAVKRSMLLLALAACGAGDQGDAPLGPGGDGAGPPTGAGGQTCAVQVVLPRDPEPVASATTPVMVRAVVSEAPGTLHFQWQVRRDGTTIATTVQTSDGSQVSFLAPIAAVYDVRLDVLGALTGCPTVIQAVNVDAPDAVSAPYRIRVAPGIDAPAAPFETTTTIRGGATRQLGPLTAPPSAPIDFHVVAAATGAAVPALVHLIPLGAAFPDPGVANEAFSDAAGRVELRAPSGLADAIVVPVQAGLAAQRFTRVQPGAIFALTAATLTGSVRDPGGAPLAGAKVQLAVDGVPSSLATTASNGTFTVFAEAAAGQTLTLEVTPPAASGLPRLTATSSKLDVTAPLQIAYGANLTRRDLAGLVVTREGAPLPRARLTVVGAIGAGGTVTTGGAPVVATGEVVLGATSDDAGALPSLRVPAAALSAVVAAGGDDFAVVALDTTAGAPARLEAPAPRPIPSVVTTADGAGVAGAIVDAIPTGALAKVAAPSVRAIAATGAAAGQVSMPLALGGHYDVRIHDPAGRGALTALSDVAATAVPSAITLTPAIELRGSVLYPDGSGLPRPLGNAAVQILCADCTGLAADRPLAEGTTDAAGRFALAIPDPDQVGKTR